MSDPGEIGNSLERTYVLPTESIFQIERKILFGNTWICGGAEYIAIGRNEIGREHPNEFNARHNLNIS